MAQAVTTRSRRTGTPQIVDRFMRAFAQRNVEAALELVSEDCVFVTPHPAPDGERLAGRRAVRRFWESTFRAGPLPQVEVEDQFACGDRCVVQWRSSWLQNGRRAYLRGVDLYRIRDGKITEKVSYVKG